MAPTLPKVLWIAAIVAAFAAILSVAFPSPQPVAPSTEPQLAEAPQRATEAGVNEKKDTSKPSPNRFIQQAHRGALDPLLAKVEAMMPTLALWELLRVDAPVKPPHAVLSSLNFTQARTLEIWARELNEIDAKQLDPKRKIYHRSAQFILARAMNAHRYKDPLSTLRLTQRVSDALLGSWLRREDPTAWLDPVRSLTQQWEHFHPPGLNHAQRKALRNETRVLIQRLRRWQQPKAQSYVSQEWPIVFAQLEQALNNHQRRALAQPASTKPPRISAEQWKTWTRWELGHSPTPDQAAAAIQQSAQRLSAIQERLSAPNRRSSKSRPDLAACREARETLHAQVPTPGPWIEHKVSCQALLALAPPADTQALMHALVLHGWVDPTRLQVRRQQRPLMAGLASRWGASVHAQLRELMFLARLPVQDWSQDRQRSIIDALQADLCHSFALLQTLEIPLQSTAPPRCGPARRAAQHPDAYAAFRGIRVAAMPQTRARMAGLDRFYWAPPKLALYWATPPGQDPDSPQEPSPRTPARSAKLEALQRTP